MKWKTARAREKVWETRDSGDFRGLCDSCNFGLTPEDSIALADIMGRFMETERLILMGEQRMKLWAHRGCSQRYPENTLIAFEKAAQLQGLAGIELDIQLTKDGQIVVIHDEKVDRTTDGSGWSRDYTLAELKRLKIDAGCYPHQVIPTMEEVS
ncbi:MAG: glycerophosphodiester phosphodiesterase family protein [Enterocloster sp.]